MLNIGSVIALIKSFVAPVKSAITDLQPVSRAVQDVAVKVFADSGATANSGYYIGNNGVASIQQSNYEVTEYVDISMYSSIRIKAYAHYANRYYAFYDEDKVLVSLSDKSPNNSTHTLYEAELSVPNNVKYIVVSGFGYPVTETPKVFLPTQLSLKEHYGKKWVCIGDSLTAENARTTMHYHDYIAEKTGITIVNLGSDGAGYKRKYDENKSFIDKVADVPLDADVVTIFGSGNDGTYVANDLGNVDDTGTTTLCGCINTCIDALIARIPTVSLGIVSPTPWIGNPPSNASCSMAIISETLKTICANRSIPFLDLYHCSNLRPWTEEGRAACYTKDEGNGVHPDETGHKLIAPRFKEFVDSLLL